MVEAVAEVEPALRLRVLGPTQLQRAGQTEPIPSARQRSILAILAAAEGRAVPAAVLIDAVWGDQLPDHPEAALQTQLTRVRHLLGSAHSVRADPTGYRLALDRHQVDAWRFEDLATPDRDEPNPRAALTEALSLWRGEALADAAGHPSVQLAASHLEELRRQATLRLASAHLDADDPVRAQTVIDPLLAEDPYRERARAVELRALCAAGRPTEALARYQEHRRRLAEDLGVEPSPGLQQLEHEILDHRVPTAAGPLRDRLRPATTAGVVLRRPGP